MVVSKYKARGAIVGAALLGAWGMGSYASAAPMYTPFLSVQFLAPGTADGTQSGFSPFTVANSSSTSPDTATVGGYSVTIGINPAATGGSLGSRDRPAGGNGPYNDLYQDFGLGVRDSGHALGYTYLAISVAGLTPNATYEFTGFSWDNNSQGSAAANADRDGYSPNVPVEYAPGSSPASGGPYYYTPIFITPVGEYDDSVSFDATANASGVLTVYNFGDTNSYSGQTADIVNGFQLGAVPAPEPASFGVMVLGALGLVRRRSRKA